MRAVYCELRRALQGKWFLVACFGTVCFLWLGIGGESYWILRDSKHLFDAASVIEGALTSESAVLSLPALAALPCAADALSEFACGAMRQKVFICGRRVYKLSKIACCAMGAMLSQLIAMILFGALLSGISFSRGAAPVELAGLGALIPLFGARMLTAAAFACFGSAVALVTGAAASAYVAPLAMCFALKLFGGRFFIGVPYVDPAEWLTGDDGGLRVAFALSACMLTLMGAALGRELKRHA